MKEKFTSLRFRIAFLLTCVCLSLLFIVLFVAQLIFDKYYSATCRNYLYDLCMATSDSLTLNAIDIDDDSNNIIEYLLSNISIEGIDNVEVYLLDNEGKFVYSEDKNKIGRYVSENEIIENIVIKLRNGEEITSGVSESFVSGSEKFVAYTITLGDSLLFMQIDRSEFLQPVYELFLYCILIGLVVLVITIIIGMIFVDKISINEKKIQHELELEKEYAEKANNAKSDFLANMSHEIRTPINAVLGMNEMILRENKEKNIQEYSNTIKSAGYTLLSLINDILDFSKISSGKLNLVNADYDVGSLFNDLIAMFNLKANTKGLSLKINIDPTFPSTLFGDEVRIKQIITNILSNAVKYTNEGYISFSAKVISSSNGIITFRIAVQDTGIGIKKEDIEKLFVSFERFDEKANKNVEGTGLGMAITKNLLNIMDSDLNVVSEYGKGSVFSFILKQKIIDQKPIGDINLVHNQKVFQDVYVQKFVAPDAHILIVDDVEMNINVSLGLMKNLQMQIDTATSGQEAIDKCRQNEYDLILMDYMMPDLDGIQTTEIIRQDVDGYKFTPIIALTADAVVGAKTKFTNAGMQDYITKPINVEKLENSLAKWLPKEKLKSAAEYNLNTARIIKERDNSQFSPEKEAINELNETPKTVVDNYTGVPYIEGIDSKKALEILGSIELFIESLKMYHDSIDKKSKLIDEYEKTNDIENYTIQVHALKSMSKSIAAKEVADLAEHLEACGKAGELDEIHTRTPELLLKYREFKDKLLIYSQNGKKEFGEMIGINDLKIKLDDLSEYINNYDIDSAEKWLDNISQMDYANYTELQLIKDAIKDIKFNDCKNAINDLLIKIDKEEN